MNDFSLDGNWLFYRTFNRWLFGWGQGSWLLLGLNHFNNLLDDFLNWLGFWREILKFLCKLFWFWLCLLDIFCCFDRGQILDDFGGNCSKDVRHALRNDEGCNTSSSCRLSPTCDLSFIWGWLGLLNGLRLLWFQVFLRFLLLSLFLWYSIC